MKNPIKLTNDKYFNILTLLIKMTVVVAIYAVSVDASACFIPPQRDRDITKVERITIISYNTQRAKKDFNKHHIVLYTDDKGKVFGDNYAKLLVKLPNRAQRIPIKQLAKSVGGRCWVPSSYARHDILIAKTYNDQVVALILSSNIKIVNKVIINSIKSRTKKIPAEKPKYR